MLKKFPIINFLLFITFYLLLPLPIQATLTLKSTPKDIKNELGLPRLIAPGPTYDTWYYDHHYIHVAYNRIIAYSNATALNIKLTPKHRSKDRWLNLNSKKDDILSILGTPTRIDRGIHLERWYYGADYIGLKDDKIHYYSNKYALKFQLKPSPFRFSVAKGDITDNDLIKSLGTPDRIRKGIRNDEWWYKSQFFRLENRIVTFIDNDPIHNHHDKPQEKVTVDPRAHYILKHVHHKGRDPSELDGNFEAGVSPPKNYSSKAENKEIR